MHSTKSCGNFTTPKKDIVDYFGPMYVGLEVKFTKNLKPKELAKLDSIVVSLLRSGLVAEVNVKQMDKYHVEYLQNNKSNGATTPKKTGMLRQRSLDHQKTSGLQKQGGNNQPD